jgi:hypothetical protein
MKKINELTEREILDLTDEQIEKNDQALLGGRGCEND